MAIQSSVAHRHRAGEAAPGARANFDVQSHVDLEANDVVGIAAAAKPAILLHPRGYRYFSMLRDKLRWNERNS